jgi:hypothetical protein
MLEDGEDFYRLDDGKGEFRVAKNGLSPEMRNRVVQHFAGGGVVAPQAEPVFDDATWSQMMALQGGQPAPQAGPSEFSIADPSARPPLDPSEFPETIAPTQTFSLQSSATAPVEQRYVSIPAPATEPVAAPTLAAPPPAPVPTSGGSPGMPGMGGAPRMPNTQAEIKGAELEGIQAARTGLEAQQKQAQAESQIRQAAALEQEARVQKFADINAAHQARGDKLYNDVLTGQINPNKLWESRTTGQQIGSSIAIILSGIGQGLAGGPNMALSIIDKAIDRDIDAQKTNLSKKENALAQHMQMGRDMATAQQLVKADARDAIAAQLEAASAKFGDQRATAAAMASVAAMKEKSATERHTVAVQDMGLFLEQEKIASDRLKAAASAKDGNAELFVPGYGFALDPKAAAVAREATAAHGSLVADLNELISLRKTYGVEKAPTDARARMETLQGAIMGNANQLYRFGALDKGSQQMLELMMGNATALGNQQAKMEQFKKSVERKMRGVLKSYMDPRTYKDPGEFAAKLEQ